MELDRRLVSLNCLVTDVVPGYDALLGVDFIAAMGGVTVSGRGRPTFGGLPAALCSVTSEATLAVTDKDFSAAFSDGRWVVRWKWSGEEPSLTNKVARYHVKAEANAAFEEEVEQWIADGWLRPFDEPHDGITPLMAVVQRNKDKVRPVMDYRELNKFVSSHTGDSSVCNETLRRWRRMGSRIRMVDLRKAYLQLHVHPELWKHQVVEYKGRRYCLTRLGFGLNVWCACVCVCSACMFAGVTSLGCIVAPTYK